MTALESRDEGLGAVVVKLAVIRDKQPQKHRHRLKRCRKQSNLGEVVKAAVIRSKNSDEAQSDWSHHRREKIEIVDMYAKRCGDKMSTMIAAIYKSGN